MESNELLIVFAKAPIAGLVKTRLFPHLTFEEAAEIQRAFLTDIIENLVASRMFNICLAYTPEGSLDVFKGLYGDKLMEYHLQEGRDLGERMANAFNCAFDRGMNKAAIIGTDVPTLPVRYICSAFQFLDESDIVLGPAEDGGYYLIAMKRPNPGLFDGMRWSARGVFAATVSRAKTLGLHVSCLPPLRDIDTFEDLKCLLEAPLPPNTRRIMDTLENRLKSQSDWLV